MEALAGEIEYGLKTLDGEVCWKNHISVNVEGNGVACKEIEQEFKKSNTYLYAKGVLKRALHSLFP